MIRHCLAALILATAPQSGAAQPEPTAPVLAPGWTDASFEAPVPGTYDLPPLGPAADGEVLDTRGVSHRLHDLIGGKVSVLSFIYASCPDVNACPLATYVLTAAQRRIAERGLQDRARLLTVSFDPERDTPAALAELAGHVTRPDVEWRFLTTQSPRQLEPLLSGYGQTVRREYDSDGNPLATFSHVLRVYLIDQSRTIRNIYTTSFLHADTLLSDIESLLAEAPVPSAGSGARDWTSEPGDDRSGYESRQYLSRSRALSARRGNDAELLSVFANPPLGLPNVPTPNRNPITEEKLALGRKLFFDRRLSHNDTVSCAMCHVPEQGFTNNEVSTAVGIEGRTVRRNAPTIYNSAYATHLFHDGRESTLEQQIWGPLLARNEMGNPSVGYVVDKISALDDYPESFARAFGERGISMETIGMALASYERALVSGDSPFDRWRYGHDDGAISAAARRGFAVFSTRGRCTACHNIAERYALFTDGELHNTGIGFRASMRPETGSRRLQVAPGTFVDVDPGAIAAASEPIPSDVGRYEITGRPDDRWKYKTPSLRNVALTAPYMHDGSIATLEEVVDFYDRGAVPNPLLDRRLEPLGLSAQEKRDLVSFLRSLTGSNVQSLVSDAFAAPIGDPH